MSINAEQKMIEYLRKNPGKIGAIGEELLNKELEKRKNGEESKILNLLEEQGKCIIYTNSPDYIRNNEYLILENLKANPGRIGVIGEELLNKELEKRKNGEESEILNLLEEQGICNIYYGSSDNLKNNEYLMLEHLKSNPGRISVIGEELLNKELEKRKNGEESEILNLLEEQGKCIIFTGVPDYIRNNEYLILENLKANPGRIGVIGEELLNKELEKRKSGKKSEILSLLEEQGKCIIFTDSLEYIRNNEYLILENLKANPGRIGVIGEELLNKELEKRKNGEESEILNLLEKQGKCNIYYDSPDKIKNNEYLILEHLKANPGQIDVIGEELLNKELEKRKKGEKSEILNLLEEQGKCIIYTNSPDYIRNNEYLILENLKANIGRIGVIGSDLIKIELEKKANGKKSEILDVLEKNKECYIYEKSSEIVKNSEYLILRYLKFNLDANVDYIGEKLLRSELKKGFSENQDNKEKKHNSEIINRILKLKENKLPNVLLTDIGFMKSLVEQDIKYLGYLDEITFKEIWKDENIREKAKKEFILKASSSDFIKNNDEIIEISINNDKRTINYIGESKFEKYLEKYKDKFYIMNSADSYVKKNEKAIKYTIQNKPAQFCYIDQEILISEFNKVINNEQSDMFDQLIKSLNIKDKTGFITILTKLYEKNNSVLFNLNINLLKENYIKIRPYLNIICDDITIQENIIDICADKPKNLDILSQILNSIKANNRDINYKDLFADVISGMANPQYKELLNNLKNIELNPDDIEKLGWIFCNENYFSINTLEDVRNLDSIINSVCDSIMQNPNGDFSKYPLINQMDVNTRRIHAIMQRSGYMMGIFQATQMVQNFLPLFDGIEISDLTDEELAIYEELININYILSIKDNEEYVQYLSDAYKRIVEQKELKTYKAESYQTSVLCNLATKRYNKKCFNTSKNDVMDTIIYDGEKIDIFNAGTDFSMLIHALGAYNSEANVESYIESWNRAETMAHGFSTSYIGNGMLGTARIDSVVYGFNDIEEGGLLATAPWDIASNTYHNGRIPIQSMDTLNKLSKGNRVRFYNPEKQLSNTRHTHNEVILERYIVQKDGTLKKRQPNYIVYFADNFDKETAEKDQKWKESKRAAKEFGIPIVVVEREKCAKKESEEIEKILQNGRDNNSIEDVLNALNKIQTNIAGNREYHTNIQMKYFPDSKTNEILSSIKEILKKDITDGNYEKFLQDYRLTIKFDEEEKKKWEITGLVKNNDYKGYDHELFQAEINEIYNLYKSSISSKSDKLDVINILENEDQDIKNVQYSEKIADCISKNEQIASEEVIEIINKYNIEDQIKDIKSQGIYDERKAHSIYHIQDVMIFGAVLGKMLGLSDEDMKLLIEACKYHDSGRKDDINSEHADLSQKIAKEKLESLYSNENLGIIRSAIMFHEYNETSEEESNKYFESLCLEYGVQPDNILRARLLANILKDADALDRCRFVNRAELNPDFLRFKQSYSLVEVAKRINEGYAKNICERYVELEDENVRKQIAKFGYIKTSRDIRKSQYVEKKKELSVRAIGRRVDHISEI